MTKQITTSFLNTLPVPRSSRKTTLASESTQDTEEASLRNIFSKVKQRPTRNQNSIARMKITPSIKINQESLTNQSHMNHL